MANDTTIGQTRVHGAKLTSLTFCAAFHLSGSQSGKSLIRSDGKLTSSRRHDVDPQIYLTQHKDFKLRILDQPRHILFCDPGFCRAGDSRFLVRDPIVNAIT